MTKQEYLNEMAHRDPNWFARYGSNATGPKKENPNNKEQEEPEEKQNNLLSWVKDNAVYIQIVLLLLIVVKLYTDTNK